MQVIRDVKPDLFSASIMTLGMFDGMHRGHQALIRACTSLAKLRNLPSVVFTYEPHPSFIIDPKHIVHLLTLFPEKLERLAISGIDAVVVPVFTHAFSHLPAEQFIRDILIPTLHPSAIIVGYRSTFGYQRSGNTEMLQRIGQQMGITIQIVPPIEVAGTAVSSTRIRESLAQGNVALAEELLGYRYQITGYVTHGDERGRTLGVPTANLAVPEEKVIPGDGVYAVNALVGDRRIRGVMNIGQRPTFERSYSIEVHLLDFSENLYGQNVTVVLLQRLREVRSFASSEELIAQIQQDISAARAIL